MTQEIICTVCPKSCRIEVKAVKSKKEASGGDCAKGKNYAIVELTDPRRIFTTTAAVEKGELEVVPVRSSGPIKRNEWKKAKMIASGIIVKAPVKFGQVLAEDFLEKGIKLVATREIAGSGSGPFRDK